jgi:hypothetical protein
MRMGIKYYCYISKNKVMQLYDQIENQNHLVDVTRESASSERDRELLATGGMHTGFQSTALKPSRESTIIQKLQEIVLSFHSLKRCTT